MATNDFRPDADDRLTPPDFRLHGKCALLTGAARGIGWGMAEALASAGCAVAIQDIALDVAEAAAVKVNRAGGRAVALGGDLTDLDAVGTMVAQAVERLGGLHIVVNNGSVQTETSYTDMPLETMRRELDCDLLGPLILSRDALPHFRAAGYGRVINVSSIQADVGSSGMPIYSASKAALNRLTRSLAMQHAPEGFITVNAVSPGYFDTLRNATTWNSDQHKADVGKRAVPIGRLGVPADVGGIAVLLCSPAGAYITGQIIHVDGGMSAR